MLSCNFPDVTFRWLLLFSNGPSRPRKTAIAQVEQDYRVNDEIKIREICLIDQHGEKIGVIAVERAREIAVAAGLDLVEVAPNSRPPVCRIMDYGKFRYEIQKKHRGHKHHESQLHEVRVRPNIDKHDLGYKIEKAREFLLRGDKVLVDCRFRGREIAHPEIGIRVCKTLVDSLADIARVETPSKIEGKRMTMLLARKGQSSSSSGSSGSEGKAGHGGGSGSKKSGAVPGVPGVQVSSGPNEGAAPLAGSLAGALKVSGLVPEQTPAPASPSQNGVTPEPKQT